MTQCLVVMQPTFLPWSGYFNLIAQADDFIILDDVQLEKQSWQTRNRLIVAGQPNWISVPIRRTHLAQTIAETMVVDETHWREKLGRGVSINYAKHPYFSDAYDIINYHISQTTTRLAELNENTIRYISAKLHLKTRWHRASALNIVADRTDRLVAFCNHFSAEEYLSPVGSAEYLEEDGFMIRSPSKLRLQNYIPASYLQKGLADFYSHLSIVDVVANMGWDLASEYVRCQQTALVSA